MIRPEVCKEVQIMIRVLCWKNIPYADTLIYSKIVTTALDVLVPSEELSSSHIVSRV